MSRDIISADIATLKRCKRNILFGLELVCSLRSNADLSGINALCLKWVNDDQEDIKPTLYFDCFEEIAESSLPDNFGCSLTLEEGKEYKVAEYRRLMSFKTPRFKIQ